MDFRLEIGDFRLETGDRGREAGNRLAVEVGEVGENLGFDPFTVALLRIFDMDDQPPGEAILVNLDFAAADRVLELTGGAEAQARGEFAVLAEVVFELGADMLGQGGAVEGEGVTPNCQL